MKKYLLLALPLISAASMLAGCQKSDSDSVYSPTSKAKRVSQNAGGIEFDITPKAEILFVVDNSASMSTHIANLRKNIDKFVDGFSKNNPIDYKLAVVAVHDHRKFESAKYLEKFPIAPQLGAFQGEVISSSDENLVEKLKAALNVGVKELGQGGPEVEESFSPIAKVFGVLNHQPTDTKFFLSTDSYKIIFFITDANDASKFSASEVYYSLVAQAEGDRSKIMAFGAIVPSAAHDCKRDPGSKAVKIEEFLKLAHRQGEAKNIVSLCSDFGDSFARFGKSIKTRTAKKVIPLNDQVPEFSLDPSKTLRVFYGTQEIPIEGEPGIIGFTYDPNSNTIHLNPELKLEPVLGARLRVEFTPIHVNNLRNGRVKRFGE